MNDEFYEKDGKKYTRVTRILGYFETPDLVKWKLRVGAKEAKRISAVATKIGTNVDDAIRATFDGKPFKLKSKEAENCYKAFLLWREDYGIKEVLSATTQFDDEASIAGTPDLWLPGETCDIKCSSSIRDSYWLQTEWYARRKGHGFKSVLRLDKNLAMYEYKKIPVSDYDLKVFESLVTVFRFYNREDFKDETPL